mmetsp:Transcript_16351/g.49459  ORF Transcript_16351/g.49459 Transcript_16351/m.49459 type:complete len:308 (-) Transcript_16351:1791-2714(-)
MLIVIEAKDDSHAVTSSREEGEKQQERQRAAAGVPAREERLGSLKRRGTGEEEAEVPRASLGVAKNNNRRRRTMDAKTKKKRRNKKATSVKRNSTQADVVEEDEGRQQEGALVGAVFVEGDDAEEVRGGEDFDGAEGDVGVVVLEPGAEDVGAEMLEDGVGGGRPRDVQDDEVVAAETLEGLGEVVAQVAGGRQHVAEGAAHVEKFDVGIRGQHDVRKNGVAVNEMSFFEALFALEEAQLLKNDLGHVSRVDVLVVEGLEEGLVLCEALADFGVVVLAQHLVRDVLERRARRHRRRRGRRRRRSSRR